MRRVSNGRPFPAAMVAAIALCALVFGGCVRDATQDALATPIGEGIDFAFEELLTVPPSSASPSPSPSLVPSGSTGGTSARSGAPSSSQRSAPAAAPSGPVNCPSGSVSAEMTDFSASETGDTRNGVPEWLVRVRGSATNGTSRAVRDIRVRVTVNTDNADADTDTAVIGKWVGNGSSASWTVEMEYESDNEPDEDDVSFAVAGWSYGDANLDKCPKHGSSS